MTTLVNQYRGTDAARGERAGAVRRLAGTGHKFQLAFGQGGSRSGTVGQLSILPLTLPRTWPGRFANGLPAIFVCVARGVALNAAEPLRHVKRRDRRLVLSHAGTGRFNSCRALTSCGLSKITWIELEPAKQSADPLHTVQRLSCVAGFDDQQRREAETQNVGIPFQRA